MTSRDTLWLTSVPGVDVVVRHTQTQSLRQRIVYTGATHRPSQQKKQPQCCHDTCDWPAWLIPDNVLPLDRVALSFCRTLWHQRYCVQRQYGEVHYLHFLWFYVRPGRDSKRNHLPLTKCTQIYKQIAMPLSLNSSGEEVYHALCNATIFKGVKLTHAQRDKS